LPGGRVRGFADGLVFLVDLLFPVPTLIQYLAFGALFGATAGKAVVVGRERRSGEMPPDRVRHIELAGVAAGVSLTVLAAVAQVLLALP
jgi:hypothetical protein